MKYPAMEDAQKFTVAYNLKIKPLCKELGMPQTAFDILMFLANNPSYHTARDIVEIRKIKANLISINVEKLVQDGYLTRRRVDGDRRKIGLYLTEKAYPVVEKGAEAQQEFFNDLIAGMDESQMESLQGILVQIVSNLDRMIQEGADS